MTVPYATPPTAVAGATLPAADWNTKVRDSLESSAKPPRVYVYKNADQLVSNAGAVSMVTWANELYDTDNFWVIGSASRLTIPAGLGGLYLFTANPIWDINGAGGRYASLYKNGVGYGAPVNSGGSAAWYTQHQLVTPVVVVPGDYLELGVYQNSGVALNLKGSVYSMVATLTRIGVA